MTHFPRALVAALIALALPVAGCGGCGKTAPEPLVQDEGGAAAADTAGASAWLARHPRDDGGHLIPRSSPPPDDPSAQPPKPSRDPDWDLDSDDAARDYVRRYALGTKRYGTALDCVEVAASSPAGDRRSVAVKTAAGCPGAGTVRDVFLVDVAGDRMTVDDRSTRDPLARWPDGSDPEGPSEKLSEMVNVQAWRGPVKDQLTALLLVPIRVQTYGRGTYPVVTLAGWHGAVSPGASPSELRSMAESVCRATGGAPMAFLAGIDRSRILRIRCPGGARWDAL
ncbi:MAG TPA: hypothetical protein VIF15_16595 [Polyangiaceae bacterium]|jgi:hypothetical protein